MLLERLERESGIPAERLLNLAKTASKRYYLFEIDKKTGGKRLIAHPSRALKGVQRWINVRLLRKLPIHNAAVAYRSGISIRDNAIRHSGTRFTLRMDFANFFPSFKEAGVRQFLIDQALAGNCQLELHDIAFVVKIVSRHGELTIGAPTSPMLTNAMMHDFDAAMQIYCDEHALVYTRYADDVFVSATYPGILTAAKEKILATAETFRYATLTVNQSKTAFLSRKYRRSVTGLVLTPENKISIGRDRKRMIKSLVHMYFGGRIDPERIPYLKGMLAFISDADPAFRESLERKYGLHAITTILKN